ncbi:MAG: methylated-DNA--[protein]-cysteine S-methyltransferase [Dehalococcoidia bacterium]|nr:methylated-DNA--[protein]-cysteine S-methyltransferase [Dehalococcoidia bacterium]
MTDLHDETLWRAVLERDAGYDGIFYYGVTTTGVYCRPQCPSRKPKRENTVFSFSGDALQQAGFRPCRRCKPDGVVESDAAEMVVRLCRFIENADTMPSLADIAPFAAMSESAVERLFRGALGISPHEYADAHRRERFRQALQGGMGVLSAAYESGYGSSSRVYEGANGHLGMTPKAYRDRGRGQHIGYTVVDTELGSLLVAGTGKGICSVKLGDNPEVLLDEFRREFAAADLLEAGEEIAEWTGALVDYLSGTVPWPRLPYDVRATAFQRRVWEYLRAIPEGRTKHYSEVAAELGQPTATRAVARACATNPVALVVPCHRVVPKSGGLAGFRWGIERKRALIEMEADPTP